jgi:hypothetical protein
MQWITIGTPSFSIEQVDAVLAQVGRPDGLEARYVGTTDGQVRIVSLGDSKAHADRYFAETLAPVLARMLAPVLARMLGPEPAGVPEVVGIDVARSYVREAVA